MKKSQRLYLPLKRLIGIIGSSIGIFFCLSLLWWWIFIINLFVTKGHPIFVSKRVGRNGKEFGLLKFRSMKNDADPEMTACDERTKESTTMFGIFLRKLSLDETLQLFNIFIGQMAFVGPRPLINVDVDSLTIQKRKENGSIILRPGLSGLAQIHDSIKTEPLKKADYDYEYYCKISLWTDIKIFFITIFKIFGYRKD